MKRDQIERVSQAAARGRINKMQPTSPRDGSDMFSSDG